MNSDIKIKYAKARAKGLFKNLSGFFDDRDVDRADSLTKSVLKSEEELSQARKIYETKHEQYIKDIEFLIVNWPREVDMNHFPLNSDIERKYKEFCDNHRKNYVKI